MKFGEYLASKAVALCFYAITAILWGVFAFLTGANAALLWGSVGFFGAAVIVRYALGYAVARRRLNCLNKIKDTLAEKYLLGELVPAPHDATEREYFEIMKEVSRSAVGEVQTAVREKEDYFDSVEKWIHEIKTPLTACTLICDNGGSLDKIRCELKKADNLTDTVLQYARLRSSERDTRITETHIAEIINGAVLSQREILIAAKISVSVEGDFKTCTDGKSVCFIIKQLLINCAKYCPGCHIEIAAEGGKILFSDNGAGIASYELPRIFDRGFTGGNGKSAGTGMGLFIVSELCKKLSVSVTVNSEEGRGTVFCFEFPQYVRA